MTYINLLSSIARDTWSCAASARQKRLHLHGRARCRGNGQVRAAADKVRGGRVERSADFARSLFKTALLAGGADLPRCTVQSFRMNPRFRIRVHTRARRGRLNLRALAI